MTADFLMQWFGFLGIVAGSYAFARDQFHGAWMTGLGCAFLTIWCGLQSPIPWGVLGVQVLVCALSIRTMLLHWVGGPEAKPR